MSIEIKKFNLRFHYNKKGIKVNLKYAKIQNRQYFGFVDEEDFELALSHNYQTYFYVGFTVCTKRITDFKKSKLGTMDYKVNQEIYNLFNSDISFDEFVYRAKLEIL